MLRRPAGEGGRDDVLSHRPAAAAMHAASVDARPTNSITCLHRCHSLAAPASVAARGVICG